MMYDMTLCSLLVNSLPVCSNSLIKRYKSVWVFLSSVTFRVV